MADEQGTVRVFEIVTRVSVFCPEGWENDNEEDAPYRWAHDLLSGKLSHKTGDDIEEVSIREVTQ